MQVYSAFHKILRVNQKFIFVTGGVISSLGKGITAASIASLLESRGLKVAMLKLDPYLNVDPGTMNPFQHGEVYVTDDGAETDLDLGHYYRFSNSPLSKFSNATTGQIYDTVIKKERRGDYLGKTVQVIPHITDEIKNRILACASQIQGIEVIIVETGGTVGDIESLPFLEAIRQFENELSEDCVTVHLTYVPYLKTAGEIKTKPTQHSVQALRAIGIIPHLIICRCESPLSDEIKSKISLFCNVPEGFVIEEPDVHKTIYEVPLQLSRQALDEKICTKLGLKTKQPDVTAWEKIINIMTHPKKKVVVGIVGKYIQNQDAYKSVVEALEHGGIANQTEVEIKEYNAEKLGEFDACDGYLVPGGFGKRGWDGKIKIAKHCRENRIPYFGICLGMQVLVVEFARNVLNLDANSTEMDQKTPNKVISLLNEQRGVTGLGGTMRLGAFQCSLFPGAKVSTIYNKSTILERHRHRYEFNNQYQTQFEEKGLMISGIYNEKNLCEIVELKNHPWMIGVQFHPEFKSKPTDPHPLFKQFIAELSNG